MEENAKLLKALGDVTRLRIIQHLLDGRKCACSVVPFAGKAQPTVSRHLKVLVESGVLETKRKGVNIWYRIRSKKTTRIMKILGISKLKNKTETC